MVRRRDRADFADNTPLRGTKYTVWDGGIRVPMLWRWPGQLPAGRESGVLASTLDLMPTLVGVAGGEYAGDGLDLVPALRGETDVAHSVLHWDLGFEWAVRAGDWKLSWFDGEDPHTIQQREYEHAPMGDGWFLADLRPTSANSTTASPMSRRSPTS